MRAIKRLAIKRLSEEMPSDYRRHSPNCLIA